MCDPFHITTVAGVIEQDSYKRRDKRKWDWKKTGDYREGEEAGGR